jgi:hypothetical protein
MLWEYLPKLSTSPWAAGGVKNANLVRGGIRAVSATVSFTDLNLGNNISLNLPSYA